MIERNGRLALDANGIGHLDAVRRALEIAHIIHRP
jgi:hypothetical protein